MLLAARLLSVFSPNRMAQNSKDKVSIFVAPVALDGRARGGVKLNVASVKSTKDLG